MSLDQGKPESLQTLDVKISIPELTSESTRRDSFWLRSYGTSETFERLQQDCINHPDVIKAGNALQRVPASRHFWSGQRMMLRRDLVGTASREGGANEVSLVLRRDYYRISPARYVAHGVEEVYVDAEASIEKVIDQIVNKEERPCCFDLFSSRRKRLDRSKSLADYGLFPAMEDSSEPFPETAALLLRPRTSWQAYLLMAVAIALGLLLGYGVIVLSRH